MEYTIKSFTVKLQVAEGTTKKADNAFNVVNILRGHYATLDSDQEHMTVMFLDNKLNVRGIKTVFSGGMTQSTVDMRVIFRLALLAGATSIIIAHNHPSGDCTPSIDDHNVTNRIKDIGAFHQIPLTDHIILGSENEFYSYQENKLI